MLNSFGYPYFQDIDGDWHITIDLDRGRTQEVIIRSETISLEFSHIREIFSIAGSNEGEFPEDLTLFLLNDSYKNRTTGCWTLSAEPEINQNYIVYLSKLEADSDRDHYKNVIIDCAISADRLEYQLAMEDIF